MKTKPFSKLTKAQKRVAIAKDAIKQIREKRMRVAHGEYIIFCGMEPIRQGNVDVVALSKKRPCKVCQIGQAIVSGIRLFNTCTTRSDISPDSAREMVTTWFNAKNASLMEVAFEGYTYAGPCGIGPRLIDDFERAKAISFHRKHKSHSTRSIAIWKNIILNNGTFKP